MFIRYISMEELRAGDASGLEDHEIEKAAALIDEESARAHRAIRERTASKRPRKRRAQPPPHINGAPPLDRAEAAAFLKITPKSVSNKIHKRELTREHGLFRVSNRPFFHRATFIQAMNTEKLNGNGNSATIKRDKTQQGGIEDGIGTHP